MAGSSITWRQRLSRVAASPALRWTVLGLSGLAAGFIVLVLTALAALQIGPVRTSLGERAIALLGEGDGITIEVGGYSGVWPVSLGVTELVVRDDGVEIVRARDIRLGWAPLALLSGTLRITELSVGAIEVAALPQGGDEDDAGAPGMSIPRLPVAVRIEALSLPDVRLAAGIAGTAPVHLAARGSAALTGGEVSLALQAARSDADRFDLDLDLAYAPDAGTVRLALDLADDGLVAAMAGDPALAPLRATAAGKGPVEDWAGTLDLDAGGYGVLGARLEGSWRQGETFTFAARLDPGAAPGGLSGPVAVSGKGGRTRDGFAARQLDVDAAGLTFSGQLAVNDPAGAWRLAAGGEVSGVGALTGSAALPDAVRADIEAAVQAGTGAIDVATFSLGAPGHRLDFEGQIAAGFDALAGALRLVLEDAGGLAALAGIDAAGPLTLDADIARADFSGGLEAAVRARFVPERLADPALVRLAGGALDLDARLAPGERGATRIEALTLSPASGAFAVSASGQVSADGAGLAASMEVADLAAMSGLAGTPLAGRAHLEAALDGPWEALALDLALALEAAQAGGVDVAGRLEAALALEPSLSGPVSFAGEVAGSAASASLRLGVPAAGGLSFGDVTMSAAGIEASGEGSLLPAGGIALSLDGRVPTLAPAGRLAGMPLTGSGTFRLRIEPDEVARTPGPRLDARVLLRGVTAGGVAVRDLLLDAAGPPSALALSLEAEGLTVVPGAAQGGRLAADGLLDAEAARLTVSRLGGRLAGAEIALAAPMDVAFGDGIAVRPVALTVDGGRLDGAVTLTGRRLDLDLALTRFPAAVLAALTGEAGALDGVPGGVLDGTLALAGEGTRGEGTLALGFSPRVPGMAADEVPDLALDATWKRGRAEAVLTVDAPGTDDLRLEASLPLAARNGVPYVPEGALLEARAFGRADLAALWPLVPVEGHRMAGRVDVDATLSGPVRDPAVAGTATLVGGLYENADTGLLLSPLDVTARFAGAAGSVEVTAGDGGGRGTLTGTGRADFSGSGTAPRLDVRLSLDRFTAVRRDEVTADASGTVTVLWPAAQDDAGLSGPVPLTIGGEVTVTGLEARIPDTLASDVETIEVTRVTGAGVPVDPPAEDAGAAGNAPAIIAFDLAVDVPGRAFVRGRGLDSEWGGGVRIAGDAGEPIVTGAFSVVRGTFDFLGRSFDLEGGRVEFTGGAEIDPLLDVRAVHEAGDITAIVRVTGPASDPAVEVTSRPALPQEEVLARVLFGTGTGQLSPLQAVELAQATAALTGLAGGGGGGIVDAMRRSLGVDVLAVGEAGIEAGSYVRRGVYVGVAQGLEAGSGRVEVEVELTDDISLDGTVRAEGDTRAGISWERDY